MTNGTKLATLLLGATLMIGMGATTLSAEGKCGAGKCGGEKTEKPSKCGGEKKDGAGKCGGEKKDKPAKCGAGKCGSK